MMVRDRPASDTTPASPIACVVPNRSRETRDPADPGTGPLMGIVAATLAALVAAVALAAMTFDAGHGVLAAFVVYGLAGAAALSAAVLIPVAVPALARRSARLPGRLAYALRSARNG